MSVAQRGGWWRREPGRSPQSPGGAAKIFAVIRDPDKDFVFVHCKRV